MTLTTPEAEVYLAHIKKDTSDSDSVVNSYAKILEQNTQNLIDGKITIDQFENTTPNNDDIKVSHLNHMRNAIISSWGMREERLAKMAQESAI
jgi:transcription antitermination factor NusA-like protein